MCKVDLHTIRVLNFEGLNFRGWPSLIFSWVYIFEGHTCILTFLFENEVKLHMFHL